MDIIQQLRELSKNLWWVWQPEIISIFRDIDAERWRKANHNPVAFLADIPRDRILRAVKEQTLEARINLAFHRLETYLDDDTTWGSIYGGPLKAAPLAYFSAEFGLHESVPIYSGGLGILAGDHLATASDFGIPLVGIGLFYARGYFTQTLDSHGMQQESAADFDVGKLPLEPLKDDNGALVTVNVELADRVVAASLWRADVGRCSLILLDCDNPENASEDRDITNTLYNADPPTRIRQEAVLGIGGIRALRRLGIRPSLIHLNEGHSAFALLERMREEIEENGVDIEEAKRRIRAQTIFTTHTPVEAGHDRFGFELLDQTLATLREKLGVSKHEFHRFGERNDARDDTFCMTSLALRLSRWTNAVSALHARTTRRMWHALWPDRAECEVPIGHVTNGVHTASWLAPPWVQLFNEYLGEEWEKKQCNPATWTPLETTDEAQVWEVHQIVKTRLLEALSRWIALQDRRRDGKKSAKKSPGGPMDPRPLTIAFARRFASYKRANLIFSDEDRLGAILNHKKRPVRLIFAGKAHPHDRPGKELIQRIYQLAQSGEFRDRLFFIENCDINITRHLVQGADLWLNNPLRTFEACGTSGMKAMFNGVLNLSTQDGWWAEAYNGKNGFTIGYGESHADPEQQNARDADALYDTLENQVIPLYFERDKHGIPRGWVRMIINALTTLAWRYNADRMLMEYARECYLPAVGIKPDGCQPERHPFHAH